MAPPDPAAQEATHLDLPTTPLSRLVDGTVRGIAALVHWAWVLLAVIIFVNVILRYAMRTNFVWAEELQWHIYGIGIMIAIAYGISEDLHVRVDVLASKIRPVARARIELAGFALFLLPLFTLLLIYAVPFVQMAFVRNEISSAPGGLTHRWLIKSVLILAFAMMLMATVGRISRLALYVRQLRKGATG